MTHEEKLIQRQVSKKGWRGRVNAKCIECIYDEKSGSGTWRQQVEACTSTDCPLYPLRPITIQRGKEKHNE